MAWSQTAPTLPDGKAWEQEQTVQGQIQSLFHMHWKVKIARLEKNQIAVYVLEWCTRGSTANPSWFSPPSTFGATVSVNGQAGTEEALAAGKLDKGVEWYYIGSAGSGATVTLTLNDGTSPAVIVTFIAPDADGDVLYFKVGGTWKQTTLYRKGGTWKNALAKFKSEGAWK